MKEQKRHLRGNSAEENLQQQKGSAAKEAVVSFGTSIEEQLSVYPAFTCGTTKMPDIELGAVLFISYRPAEIGQL
jgi:hypothetical protein